MLVFKVQWMKVMEMYMAMADLFESWISVQWFDTEIRVQSEREISWNTIWMEAAFNNLTMAADAAEFKSEWIGRGKLHFWYWVYF